MIRPLALAALLAGFAFSLLADGSAQTRRTTPTTDWARPTEAGVAWDSGDYAYDGSGNIARIGLDAFGYDGTNRLTSGTVNAYGVATTQTFQYDRFGNILQVTTTPDYGGDFPVPPETAELEVNSGTNRLSRACKPIHGCETWTYDGATGNVLSSQKSGGTTVFSVAYGWDPAGAMTELEGGSAHERYVYDANDERIIMVSLDGDNEVIRRWTWRDVSNKVAREAVEQVGAGVWSEARDNVYRDGTLLAAYTSANAAVADRHYHIDHLGTPRLITDAARHKVAIEAYLPFGDRAPGSELPYVGFKDRMRFTGHERDGEGSPYRPSLDYMHARYYTPEWGRFLSVDPGKDWDSNQPQSWNMYAYVRNNPVKATDPDGRQAVMETLGPFAPYVIGSFATVYLLSRYSLHARASMRSTPVPVVVPTALAEHYAPDRRLPMDKRTGNPVLDRVDPVTGAEVPISGPHTQLGKKTSKDTGEVYVQGREFDEDGKRVKDIDFTDHGRPEQHTNPHEHNYDPKTGKRGGPEPHKPSGPDPTTQVPCTSKTVC